MTLREIQENYHETCSCALKETSTQPVFGTGNSKADIVFIGEAPGRKEDKTGTPFVGASGKLLDQLLESINMKREDVYITNIVKYRPPDNRDPNKKEKEDCKDWLLAELDFIKPKIICTLGRHSLNFFYPKAKISEVHGELLVSEIDNKTRNIVALYHPAGALFNGSLRPILFEDFRKLPTILYSI
jgi:uracil-DNA glycosylase family 4